MWNGRYESESFMNYSISFKAVKRIVFKKKNFVGFNTHFMEELGKMGSLYGTWGKTKKWYQYKPLKSHFFMFKSWEKSMALRYYIDALFIVVISIFMQLYVIDFADAGGSYYAIVNEFNEKRARANDTSLTGSAKTTAQSEFIEIETEFLRINDIAMDKLQVIYYLWIVLTAYWVRNIFQIIYAKLRRKSYDVITGEFILSCCHLFLVGLTLFRHYT